MKLLITDIKELIQVENKPKKMVCGEEMKILPTLKNAFLLLENDLIKDFGRMEDLPHVRVDKKIDATGKLVLPTWCDSHTHIVFAGHREQEFVDRINGMSYEDIANRGGGILNSATKLQHTTENDLALKLMPLEWIIFVNHELKIISYCQSLQQCPLLIQFRVSVSMRGKAANKLSKPYNLDISFEL